MFGTPQDELNPTFEVQNKGNEAFQNAPFSNHSCLEGPIGLKNCWLGSWSKLPKTQQEFIEKKIVSPWPF